MIRLSTYILWVLLCGTASLTAQVKNGFKSLEKKEYQLALKAFEMDLNTPGKSAAAGFGFLKAAAELKESKTWTKALGLYEKTLKDFDESDPNTQKRLGKDYEISRIAIEDAYNALFGKIMEFVESGTGPQYIRDSLVDAVRVVPRAYGARFNKLMARPKATPIVERQRLDPSKMSTKKPVYVDRLPPEATLMEFIKGINTKGSEFLPILSSDGKMMYFVGSERDDNYGFEDIFYTEKQPDGSWSEPKIETFFSGPINEAVVSMSVDGNSLVLFIGGKPHISTRAKSGWSEPQPISLPKTFFWIGQASITRNGEALIFEAKASEASSIDIYIALRKSNGDWDVPFKLDNTLNTASDERTPFLHSDFKTLYFSSNGHGDLTRGLDVFKTTRLDDTWKKWSTPENLGPKVNTRRHDYGFCIPPSGKYAYLSSITEEFRDLDIMRIPLDSAAQPEVQVVITGTLIDASGQTQKGEITVEDALTKEVLQTVLTKPDGSYTISVPKTSKIFYYATGDSLISTKRTYVDAATFNSEVVEKEVTIVTADEAMKGAALELDLFFDFAKSALRPESETELKRIYATIKGFNWVIEIGGHTDNVGTAQSNMELSTNRAQAVRDFLVALGYPAAKITFKGYGQSVPIKGNDTEEGRARNRRVEIRVKK